MDIKINLLSEEKKRFVRQRKRFRFIVFQEVFVVLLLFLYTVALYGMDRSLNARAQEEDHADAVEKTDAVFHEIDAAEQMFVEVNDLLARVKSFREGHIRWTNVLDALNRNIPDELVLHALSTNDRMVSVTGVASTREVLLAFQKRLLEDDCFSDARVPLSDLFASEHVEFQADIDVREQCLKDRSL